MVAMRLRYTLSNEDIQKAIDFVALLETTSNGRLPDARDAIRHFAQKRDYYKPRVMILPDARIEVVVTHNAVYGDLLEVAAHIDH